MKYDWYTSVPIGMEELKNIIFLKTGYKFEIILAEL